MPSDPPPSESESESRSESRSDAGRGREIGSGSASAPPPPVKGKRPRYLVVALIGAMVFGAGCWTEGCSRITFYRGQADMSPALHAAVKSDVDRARAESLYEHFTQVADAGRSRAFPMAVAIFLLGAALLAFAARGLAGKTNSRSALVQIVTAQAVMVVLAYFLTRDIRNAELDWEFEMQLIHQHEKLPPDQYEQVVPMMNSMRRFVPPGWLVVRTIASALIVFALTRPRSREFFEAAGAGGDGVSER